MHSILQGFRFHSGDYEHFCLLGHNAEQSIEIQPTIRRKVLLDTYFILGVSFDSEDGGEILFKNIFRISADYTALYSRI
jgi:hypothetical protein